MSPKQVPANRVIGAIALSVPGCVVLFKSVLNVIAQADLFACVLLVWGVLFSGMFFTSGYFLVQRRDRDLAKIWLVPLVLIAAFMLFGFISALPDRARVLWELKNSDGRLVLLHLGSVIVGFCGARWFFYAALRGLDRILPRNHHQPRSAV